MTTENISEHPEVYDAIVIGTGISGGWAAKELYENRVNFFDTTFKLKFKKPISKGNKEDIETLFSEYFTLSKETQDEMLKSQRMTIDTIPAEALEDYTLYKFLLSVRYYTLFGYYTSEKVGEDVLAYDPVPGVYNGCVPLNDVSNGKTWAL